MIRGAVVDGKAKHLIKIAIVKSAVPGNRQSFSAHDLFKGGFVKRSHESRHIIIVIISSLQIVQISANWHIGDTEQVIEHDTVFVHEDFSIMIFQTDLRAGKVSAARIMDQIQNKTAIGMSIQSLSQAVNRKMHELFSWAAQLLRDHHISSMASELALYVGGLSISLLDNVPVGVPEGNCNTIADTPVADSFL